jgi:hypothetical protein
LRLRYDRRAVAGAKTNTGILRCAQNDNLKGIVGMTASEEEALVMFCGAAWRPWGFFAALRMTTLEGWLR